MYTNAEALVTAYVEFNQVDSVILNVTTWIIHKQGLIDPDLMQIIVC